MNKPIRIIVVAGLLGSLTLQAEPFLTWDWVAPIEYESGEPIIADTLEYQLYCGTEANGPYPDVKILDLQTPPALQDMAFAVGVEGTYSCVLTARSDLYGTTSRFSNEVTFIAMPGSQGIA